MVVTVVSMHEMIGHALSVFFGLFAVMNPIANTPVFIALTADDSPDVTRRVALEALGLTFAIVVLLFRRPRTPGEVSGPERHKHHHAPHGANSRRHRRADGDRRNQGSVCSDVTENQCMFRHSSRNVPVALIHDCSAPRECPRNSKKRHEHLMFGSRRLLRGLRNRRVVAVEEETLKQRSSVTVQTARAGEDSVSDSQLESNPGLPGFAVASFTPGNEN